jgi:hypothetical protein
MKRKPPKDRRTVAYEPLLFGSLAVAAGILYLLVKTVF